MVDAKRGLDDETAAIGARLAICGDEKS